MNDHNHDKVAEVESRIAQLNEALARAREEVQSWVEANTDLSHNAAEAVKEIQRQLTFAKNEVKQLKSRSKDGQKAKLSGAKAASAAIELMHKLKEAHDAGLLTDQEYESKRQKLLAQL